ncbi:MAG: HAD family hydrolase, partial [Myxococcota bacterium]
AQVWSQLPAADRPLLCYNSGHLPDDVRALVASGRIPEPDYAICALGTEVLRFPGGEVSEDYRSHLGPPINLERLREILATQSGIEPQPDEHQTAHKSSWYLHHASTEQIKALMRELRAAALPYRLVYSNNADLDVLSGKAGKGAALEWLCSSMGIATAEVIVAGDRSTDIGMFQLPGAKGILVENAQPELFQATAHLDVYHSPRHLAEGLIDGLRHFEVIDQVPESAGGSYSDPELERLVAVESPAPSDEVAELAAYLALANDQAISALRRNITPMGFTACSLADNEVIGTDANYRSVWGRDGAISVIDSMCLDASDIRECQRRTLETLLDHTTDHGMAPANVRIDDGAPDYSGVGGICAIDSGLWLVIAVYSYVSTTGDIDFLRRYSGKLAAIMSWL